MANVGRDKLYSSFGTKTRMCGDTEVSNEVRDYPCTLKESVECAEKRRWYGVNPGWRECVVVLTPGALTEAPSLSITQLPRKNHLVEHSCCAETTSPVSHVIKLRPQLWLPPLLIPRTCEGHSSPRHLKLPRVPAGC